MYIVKLFCIFVFSLEFLSECDTIFAIHISVINRII